MSELKKLSRLIRQWNEIEAEIFELIGYPGTISNIGEYLAEQVFGVDLEKSKTQRAFDGKFTQGNLSGRTVNVKIARERERFIDWRDDALPEYFLILTGSRRQSGKSVKRSRPILVTNVYLFNVKETRKNLHSRGVIPPHGERVQASVTNDQWDEAEIYPKQTSQLLTLTPRQKQMLSLFS